MISWVRKSQVTPIPMKSTCFIWHHHVHPFYPLVNYHNVHNYGKSPCLMSISTISMTIFHSYFDITRGYIPKNPKKNIANCHLQRPIGIHGFHGFQGAAGWVSSPSRPIWPRPPRPWKPVAFVGNFHIFLGGINISIWWGGSYCGREISTILGTYSTLHYDIYIHFWCGY